MYSCFRIYIDIIIVATMLELSVLLVLMNKDENTKKNSYRSILSPFFQSKDHKEDAERGEHAVSAET